MAATLDLIIDKGSTFERVFTWKTKDPTTGVEVPVDLTGYSARAMMREEFDSPQPFLSLTLGNGITMDDNAGKITLIVTAAQSAALTQELGRWDLEVFTGDYVKRLLEGKVKIRPEVTR